MNAKYVFALILALQVSTSLCEIRQPDQELLDKYNDAKRTFIMRLKNLAERTKEAADARMETSTTGAIIKSKIDEVVNGEEYKASVASLNNLMAEMEPLLEKGRNAALGTYQEHLRPQIGQYLSDLIDIAKVYLDKIMPAQ